MKRPRPALLVLAALLATSGAVGAKAWRDLPDPIEDAREFLAPYDELAHRPDAVLTYPNLANGGLFTREGAFNAELARMAAALPKSHNWSIIVLRVRGRPSYAIASVQGTSRLQRVLRKLPFLSKVTFRRNDYVVVELSEGRAYATRAERDAAPPVSPGTWLTVALTSEGRTYPYRKPPTTAPLPYTPFLPDAFLHPKPKPTRRPAPRPRLPAGPAPAPP